MRLQGFKPLESSIKEFVEFCERLESTEELPSKKGTEDSTNHEGRGKSKRARTTETKKRGRSDDANNKFYCMLHGPNPNHDTKNCRSLKKHVDKVKKENPRRNDPAKVQEEMNAVYKYVQKKMADDRKKADRDRSAREKELNEFSDMSLEKKDSNDENDEEYWNFGPSKRQKGVFKSKKHSYKSLDWCINDSYAVSNLTGHLKTKKHYSKAEKEKLTPIIFAQLPNGQSGTRLCKTLLDSWASCSVVNSKAVQHLNCKRAKITSFKTVAGQFNCKEICNTQIKMPELKISATVDVQLHVTQMNGHYDIILGQDILSKLGIILDFQQQIVCWEDEIVQMRPTTCTQETTYNVNDTPDITAETDRMSKILDAKYRPADLNKVAKKNENLTLDQKQNCINC